jgi:hypothetical protein
VLVELFGEVDVRYRRPIEDTLSYCLVSKRSELVDLSEVKAMDSRWVRPLAFRYQRGGGHMTLSDACQDVGVSVAACGLGDRRDFMPTDDLELLPSYAAAEHPSQPDV